MTWGHTPFGHSGEYILNKICEDGFAHYEQSVRVVEVLEKDVTGTESHLGGAGRDTQPPDLRASLHPGGPGIVRLSDKIAYINHDIDDAIRARMFVESDLPAEYYGCFGPTVFGSG